MNAELRLGFDTRLCRYSPRGGYGPGQGVSAATLRGECRRRRCIEARSDRPVPGDGRRSALASVRGYAVTRPAAGGGCGAAGYVAAAVADRGGQRVSLCTVLALQRGQYFFSSSRSGLLRRFFLVM